MLHHEFQTPRNRCKHEVVRRALASVSTCLELALMKREARGFDMSSQITRNNAMTCFLWYYIGGVLSGVSLHIKIYSPGPNGRHLSAFDCINN